MLENGARAERPAAWLERVGRNAVIDRARVEQRRAELAPEIEPPPAPADPETALLARERRGLVRRALALLPRPQRRAALLRFHGELPFQTRGGAPGNARGDGADARPARAHQPARAPRIAARDVLGAGAQAAVLALTVVAAAAAGRKPSPLAMADDDVVSERPRASAGAADRAPGGGDGGQDGQGGQGSGEIHARRSAPGRHDLFGGATLQVRRRQIVSDVLGPDDIRLMIIRPADQPSLIEIRQHFVPEMVKSLEEY